MRLPAIAMVVGGEGFLEPAFWVVPTSKPQGFGPPNRLPRCVRKPFEGLDQHLAPSATFK